MEFREYLEINEARGMNREGRAIMNASKVYKGKLSKVLIQLENRYVFLDTKSKIAIIGAGTSTDPFKEYKITKDKLFMHFIDTGNGYRDATKNIILDDVLIVDKDGNVDGDYIDVPYKFFVFK